MRMTVFEENLRRAQSEFNQRLAFLRPRLEQFTSAKPAVVLSIGSGARALEVEALSNLGPISYFGIDPDQGEIEDARARFSQQKNVEFHVVDGTDYEAVAKMLEKHGGKVDLLIMRHPVLFSNNPVRHAFRKIWLEILPRVLRPGGIFVTTLYHPEEFRTAQTLTRAIVADPASITLHKEDTDSTVFLVEVQRTGLGDLIHSLPENRHMISVTDFQPHPWLAANFAVSAEQLGEIRVCLDAVDPAKIREFLLTLIANVETVADFDELLSLVPDMAAQSGLLDEATLFAFSKYQSNPVALKERLTQLLLGLQALFKSGQPITLEAARSVFVYAANLVLQQDLAQLQGKSEPVSPPLASPQAFSFGF